MTKIKKMDIVVIHLPHTVEFEAFKRQSKKALFMYAINCMLEDKSYLKMVEVKA